MNRMTPEGKAKLEELVARVMKDGQARGEQAPDHQRHHLRYGICDQILYGTVHHADAAGRPFKGR